MTPRAAGRATLARQLLLARERLDLHTALEHLGGLQAQNPAPPYLALWSRLHDFDAASLADALRARTVVRATFYRGTLHVVTANDYVGLRTSLQAALSAGMAQVLRGRVEGVSIDGMAALGRATFAGGPKSFEAVRTAMQAVHPDADERMMGFVVRTHVPLVQATDSSRWAFPARPDFTLSDEWLGRAPTADAGVETLARRYLAAWGPATARDAEAGTGHPGIRAALPAMDDLVVVGGAKGRELYDLPDAPRPSEGTPAPPRFLPEFDNLVLSHADRRRFLADEHRKRVYLPALRVAPTFLVDGRVAGVWGIKKDKRAATLVIEPFATVEAADRAALEAEGTALLAWLHPELSGTLEWVV